MAIGFPMANIGVLTITPSGSNQTPRRLTIVKDVSFSVKKNLVELRGEDSYPDDILAGEKSIDGKGKFCAVNGSLIAAILGATEAVGYDFPVIDEAGTPTTNVYTVAGGANFKENLGVVRVSTGKAMKCVASAPATGEYSLNTSTGAYTFAAADSNPPVVICYSQRNASAGVGVAPTANEKQGQDTVFGLNLGNTYKNGKWLFRFPMVSIAGADFAFKPGGHGEVDFSFKAYKDPTTGIPYTLNYSE